MTKNSIKMKIKKLDINESYFFGEVTHEDELYKINIQGEWKEKLLKTPLNLKEDSKVIVKLSGPNGTMIEDYLVSGGTSEWVEIDSTSILYYVADHQDQFDTLEIYSNGREYNG